MADIKSRFKNKYYRRLGWLTLVLGLMAAVFVWTNPIYATSAARVVPEIQATVTGVTVHRNTSAEIDASNLAEGFVMVRYTGGRDVRIAVQITKQNSTTTYTYFINSAGRLETFPLTEGNGRYTITVLENVSGNSFKQVLSATVNMTLRNEFLPFLYPNQYVNFTTTGNVAARAKELADDTSTLKTLQNVFDYVTGNFTYDFQLAATVTSGYLPDLERVLEVRKGICFDYAALMTAMLRLNNIPCQLVVGYAGREYHAWINVYIPETGWIDSAIFFDGQNWSMIDPTFISMATSTADVLRRTSGEGFYRRMFTY
jgi:hypothetical protein